MSKDNKLAVQRNISRMRREAKKAGILVETPGPHLPLTEQEQADIM